MSRSGPTDRRGFGVGLMVVGAVMLVAVVGAASGWRVGGMLGPPTGRPSATSPRTVYVNLTITTAAATGADSLSPANLTIPHGVRVVLTITNFDTGVNPTAPVWQHVMGTEWGTETVGVAGGGAPTTIDWVSNSQLSHTFSLYLGGMMGNSSMMNGSGVSGSSGGAMGPGGNGSTGFSGSGAGTGGMVGNSSNRSGTNQSGADGSGMGGGMGGGRGMVALSPGIDSGFAVGMMLNLPIPAAPTPTTPTTVVAVFSPAFIGHFTWYCRAPCDPGSMAGQGFMRGTVTIV